jgi:hypothetical protein
MAATAARPVMAKLPAAVDVKPNLTGEAALRLVPVAVDAELVPEPVPDGDVALGLEAPEVEEAEFVTPKPVLDALPVVLLIYENIVDEPKTEAELTIHRPRINRWLSW